MGELTDWRNRAIEQEGHLKEIRDRLNTIMLFAEDADKERERVLQEIHEALESWGY